MRLILFTAAVWFGTLAGCATPSGPASPAPPPSSAPVPAVPGPSTQRVTLASEQVRLSALFRGTPVVFAMQSDGRLRVVVPLRYCFERGDAAVKPPLAAVLDRLAASQRLETTRLRVTAAPDAGVVSPALARGRAQGTRDHLVAHGIATTRVTLGSAAQVDGVEIVVSEAPPH